MATARSRLPAIRSRPASARARSGSYRATWQPDRGVDLGDPMAHQPGPGHEDPLDRHAVDGTRQVTLGRPGCAVSRRRASPSSRSAAAYGSSRCSATSPRIAAVAPRGPRRAADRAAGPRRSPRPAPRPVPAGPPPETPSRPGRPMPVERGQQLRHAGTGRGRRDQDLGPLRARTRRPPAISRRGCDEHRPELRGRPLRPGLVALVDDDQVGDLEQAGLDRLDLVAHLGRLEHDRRVRRGRDLDLALAGPDGLDQDEVEARRRRGPPRPPSTSTPARRRARATPSSG